MKKTFVIVLLILSFACNQKNKIVKKEFHFPENVTTPDVEKRAKIFTAHGDNRLDNYDWLNGYFYKNVDSSKIVEYLTAENKYIDTMLAETKPLQKILYAEMKARIKEKDESVPVYKNGYYYYNRVEEGKDYFVYCRKKENLKAKEEVLLDVNKMAEGHSYFSASAFEVSPDNKLMIYAVDTLSRRQYKLFIKNLETGELLKDVIDNTEGYAVWANDNKTFFYVDKNKVTLLSEKIKKHTLGTTYENDVVVYEEKDKSNYIGVSKTKSNDYIFITSQSTLSSELRMIKANEPNASFVIFTPRMKDVLYDVEHQNNHFLITTNKDAINFKVVTAPLSNTNASAWIDYIPHRDSVLIEGITTFKNHLVISERKNGLLQIRVRKLSDSSEHYLDFGEPAYAAFVSGNPEYNAKVVRFNYTSLTTPNSVYDYDMDSKDKSLMKEQEVVGGYNKSDYITERLFATATDGTKVPVSLVYKKGFNKDGNAPCLLYGYGSYGNSLDASFSSNRLSLLNRGFVYAIAHIRGGQEMGRKWYEGGKMHNKINTFTDFISCAEYLIKEKFTSTKHLYTSGGSAGGLLMGAIVNLRPDLWHGVAAGVPFVDVLGTMSDANIPLTTNEYDEWGNPENKEDYFYMKSYSPYDNVTAKAYPNMLITTGLHDSQVQYFEPAKWVAKLRDVKTDKNLLLLKTNMEAGHGGASGRFKYLEDVALQYAFFLSLEGIGG
jgi:oligopeptidase B